MKRRRRLKNRTQRLLQRKLVRHLVQRHVHQLRILVNGGGPGVLNACRMGQKSAYGDGVVGYPETARVWTDIRCDALVMKLRQILLDGIAQCRVLRGPRN